MVSALAQSTPRLAISTFFFSRAHHHSRNTKTKDVTRGPDTLPIGKYIPIRPRFEMRSLGIEELAIWRCCYGRSTLASSTTGSLVHGKKYRVEMLLLRPLHWLGLFVYRSHHLRLSFQTRYRCVISCNAVLVTGTSPLIFKEMLLPCWISHPHPSSLIRWSMCAS